MANFNILGSETPNLFEVLESTFLYFQEPFADLNLSKLNIKLRNIVDFEILAAYSYDNKNYSNFRLLKNYEDAKIESADVKLFVCVWFKRIVKHDLGIPTNLYETKSEDKYFGNTAKITNVELPISNNDTVKSASVLVESISYGGKTFDINDFKFQEYFNLIDEFPRWNFYDNQLVNIQRWLTQCNSIAEMYGHTCIYFKTEPVHVGSREDSEQSGIHGTHYQLSTNVIRNVVDVKKLHIISPSNELPQDRIVYTDWDMPLQDDFIIHIVRQKFEQAFGLKAIPQEKDYIYFPLLNKLYRVSSMQPKNGFMGVVGWYEVFLAKYEDDDCVRVDKNLKDSLFGISDIFGDDAEFDDILEDTVVTKEKINQEVIEEQKSATQNLTNKLEDTTFYVSLKETEKLRELYDKRLKIVSVNSGDSLYPISMYDCSSVDKRNVALRYKLTDYSVTNKFSNIINTGYSLAFNFVLRGRFNGELFDIFSDGTKYKQAYAPNIISSICVKNKQIEVFDTATQTIIGCDFTFTENELYQFALEFDYLQKQYAFKIFQLKSKQKTLVYQDIYNLQKSVKPTNIEITHLQLYGGKYLVNDIVFKIDGKKFIEDNCLPLLNMYKF